MTERKSLRSLLWIAGLLQIIWGVVPSASKLVIEEIPVELYIALRWSISASLFLLYLYFRDGWRPPLGRRETWWVGALGVGGYALGSLGSLYGLKGGGVANFALVSSLSPLVTAAVSIFFLRERPARWFYLALPLSVMGLVFLITGKHQISSWQVALNSALWILGGATLEALAFVFSKRLRSHFNSLQYLAISQSAAAIFFWGLQASYFHQGSQLSQLSLRGWAAALFVSIIACVLCYAVLYWLLKSIDGHRLALFDGLHALSATSLGVIFFHENVNAMMAMGGCLLLAGLVLGNLRAAPSL